MEDKRMRSTLYAGMERSQNTLSSETKQEAQQCGGKEETAAYLFREWGWRNQVDSGGKNILVPELYVCISYPHKFKFAI